MSRVAKKPIALPKGVECKVELEKINIKGPKGNLTLAQVAGVEVTVKGSEVVLSSRDGNDMSHAGTIRAILANMVKGVNEGYQKKLELIGVGYKAAMQGKDLNLALGYSHPVLFKAPDGVSLEVGTGQSGTIEIIVKGIDKQRVGETAAKIRAYRPPNPYKKGKGLRYLGERIIEKEVKKA